ncbi:MAG TPA: hypothetical protein VG225_07925 [Terracidiphilus sp.]|jgi:hypothetical protein|nr:hypothetical protein [Terracidiphilus sp.]
MKNVRIPGAVAPAAAIASAFAALTCCLPWGIGAALATLGVSAFFGEFQVWFLILSILLLGVGFFQVLRSKEGCPRRSRTQIVLLGIAALVVLAIVFLPQWVAGLLVGRFH